MNDRPLPRIYRGFRDVFAPELTARNRIIEQIRAVYERYGYLPLETPTLEYLDALGKYLPESDQPEGGIFALRNEDKDWVALRYDLTAPLSRVVAQYHDLPMPFRRYQLGLVYRLEKPGPGRYREFYQFDFDAVGVPSMAADAEVCCVICDALEAVGVPRGKYIVRVNNRKILTGVLESVGIGCGSGDADESESAAPMWLNVLRAIDKLDQLGLEGVRQLLTGGRYDPSGDFTPGIGLADNVVAAIEGYLAARAESRGAVCDRLAEIVGESKTGSNGVFELRAIDTQLAAMGYDEDRVVFDPTVVRGLGYYTGPVIEADLTFDFTGEDGGVKRFGSVCGGGRYDRLVERFTGKRIPATGASIGMDRLIAALNFLGRIDQRIPAVHVLVTTMDAAHISDYQKIAVELRAAGVNTALYSGEGGIRRQLKYADSLNIPLAVIAGEDEFSKGELQIKDLWLGMKLAGEISDRDEWRKERPSQFGFKRSDVVKEVLRALANYKLP